MKWGLGFFIRVIHKKTLSVQRNIKRYSDSGRASVEQMLGFTDCDFRSFCCNRADKVIARKIAVEQLFPISAPGWKAPAVRRYPPFARSFREGRQIKLTLPRFIGAVRNPAPIG